MSRRPRKPRVWLVDDRKANRERFLEKHRQSFDVRVFEQPSDVMTALESGEPPDALLCDIYFYPDESQREEIESELEQKAKDLRDLAHKFKAENAQLGIDLIREIRDLYRGEPHFPIYAYTSKGPYLMADEGFEELEKLNAGWLFKNKYRDFTERAHILKGINEFQERFGWGYKLQRLMWTVIWTGAGSAFLGAVLGVLFGHWAHRWWNW